MWHGLCCRVDLNLDVLGFGAAQGPEALVDQMAPRHRGRDVQDGDGLGKVLTLIDQGAETRYAALRAKGAYRVLQASEVDHVALAAVAQRGV